MKGKVTKERNRSKEVLKWLPHRIIFWEDYDQPDWGEIQEYILKGFVYLTTTDTGGDNCAMTMTKERITEVEAYRLYRQFMHEIEEGGK